MTDQERIQAIKALFEGTTDLQSLRDCAIINGWSVEKTQAARDGFRLNGFYRIDHRTWGTPPRIPSYRPLHLTDFRSEDTLNRPVSFYVNVTVNGKPQ